MFLFFIIENIGGQERQADRSVGGSQGPEDEHR